MTLRELMDAMDAFRKEIESMINVTKDYMPIAPDFWRLIKMSEHYEPLHMYANEVTPYDGEVGRYPIKGKKVRLILVEGEKVEAEANEHKGD